MRKTLTLLTLAASVACALPAAAQNEYGIEGMGRVSTRADEAGASVSADGRLIVFASNREGGAGGWDLWQARLEDKRWGQPTALPFNGAGDETAPHLSVDGQWLYFAVAQGRGSQLYRVARLADGWGTPQPLEAANVDGAAYSPTTDGSGRLYFLHGDGKTGPTQLWQAGADGSQPAEVTGVRGAYAGVLVLGQRGDLLLADTQAQRLWHRWCEAGHWQDGQPLPLSFNDGNGRTQAPGHDHSLPAELLLAGSAASPRAGGLDVYRTAMPHARGDGSCR